MTLLQATLTACIQKLGSGDTMTIRFDCECILLHGSVALNILYKCMTPLQLVHREITLTQRNSLMPWLDRPVWAFCLEKQHVLWKCRIGYGPVPLHPRHLERQIQLGATLGCILWDIVDKEGFYSWSTELVIRSASNSEIQAAIASTVTAGITLYRDYL